MKISPSAGEMLLDALNDPKHTQAMPYRAAAWNTEPTWVSLDEIKAYNLLEIDDIFLQNLNF